MPRRRSSIQLFLSALAASLLLVCGNGTAHTAEVSRGGKLLTGAVALKSNEMAEFAYQTGCLEAYIKACGRFDDDDVRGKCFHEGLKNCGGSARNFRSWIESGRRTR